MSKPSPTFRSIATSWYDVLFSFYHEKKQVEIERESINLDASMADRVRSAGNVTVITRNLPRNLR